MNNTEDNSIYIELLSFFEELNFERISSNDSLQLESINNLNNELENIDVLSQLESINTSDVLPQLDSINNYNNELEESNNFIQPLINFNTKFLHCPTCRYPQNYKLDKNLINSSELKYIKNETCSICFNSEEIYISCEKSNKHFISCINCYKFLNPN